MYLQQGDVLLKQQKQPDNFLLEEINGDLLWKGENHHHRMRGQFKIMKSGDDIYLSSNGATMFHEEHKDIDVPEGFYKLDIVREYDHWAEESRRVID